MSTPSVIFSVGVRIPGEGMGNHAYNTAVGLDRHHLLQRAYVMQYGGTEIDPNKVKDFYIIERIAFRLARYSHLNPYLLRDNLFDWWIAQQIEPADVFYGWNHIALWSMKHAKRLKMATILERANSHPRTYVRLLADEYKKRGIQHGPYHPLLFKKHLKELETTDYIAVTSEFTKQGLLEHGIDEKRILLTPLGVDLQHFVPSESPQKDAIFRVVYVGQLCLRKGVQYLLEAWSQIKLSQSELILVGDLVDDLQPTLHTHLRQMENITVHPHTSNPAEAYREASVFVLPTLEDGFGLVVLEAMACGIPVIITEHAGVKDCVRHGVDGFVVSPYSSEDLAETLFYCYQNRILLQEMGKNARQQAEQFSWRRYQDGIVAHIRRVVS